MCQRHKEVGISSKSQWDLENCDQIKTASELFVKLKNSLLIYVHSLELRIANHCKLQILLLIVRYYVSTGYMCW